MIRRLLQVAVLALCAWLLWRTVDWQEALHLLRGADIRWLAVAVALLTAQTLLSAERWRITAGRLGIHLRYASAVREYYLAQVVNQSLPGGVLGDANRAFRAREEAGLLASTQAVVFERVAGQLGLLAVFAGGLALSVAAPGPRIGPEWLAPISGAVLATSVVLGFLITHHFRPARRILAPFARAIFAPAVRSRQILLSMATALCNIAAFALCALAIGAPLNTIEALVFIPMILFAMVLPLSIGGWGLREGAAAAVFPLFHQTAAAGLVASLAFGLVILISISPAFVLNWMKPKDPGEPSVDLR